MLLHLHLLNKFSIRQPKSSLNRFKEFAFDQGTFVSIKFDILTDKDSFW